MKDEQSGISPFTSPASFWEANDVVGDADWVYP